MTTQVELLEGAVAPEVTTKLRRPESDPDTTVFAEVCAEHGLETTAAIAAAVRLSEKTIDRVMNHGDDPSGRFIGRTLAAFPRLSFRSLFAVIDETTGKEVRNP